MIEVLLNTPLAADLIRLGDVHKLKELMKRSGEQGMITFDQALFNLYQEGEIRYEEALKYADSANEVRLMIKLQDSTTPQDHPEGTLASMSLVREDDRRKR